ncbi:hypothetical protein [Acinetobacter sp. YH1901134]|uniref:hypothetical protein n=1 Tax=Acinetobacter sp. YH1901134 TaxID=2601199 RepID=UPI0035A14397
MKNHTPLETQALDTLKSERIYLDAQIEPLNSIEVCPKLDTPLKDFEAYNMLFSNINPKPDLCLNLLKLALVWVISVFLVASCGRSAYANDVHQKADELALVGYKFSNGVQSARAFFVRKISMHSHVMAELERDTFECAGNRLSLSTNPFRLRHPHLVVNGEAPLKSSGAH